MGNNDAASVDRTTPNPQDDRGAAWLGKLVFQPDAQQKHILTLESLEKYTDVALLSSRGKPPLTAGSVVDEHASSAQRRERVSWHGHYTTDLPWADSVQTALSVQNSDAQQNGLTTRNDQGVRMRNTAYSERTWQANLQVNKLLPVAEQWVQKISVGLDYASTAVSNWFDGSDPAPLPNYVPKKYFPDSRDSSTALYAQSELRSARWSIIPGLRVEQFALDVLSQDGFSPPAPAPAKALSGSNWSPKLGVLFRPTPQWTVYANYASGFRVPNAAQVNGFVENPTPSTFVTLLANPGLQPETSNNVEFGVRTRQAWGKLDFAIFASDFQHLIVDKKPLGGSGTASDPLLFQTVNIDNARIRGFEFKGTFEWGDLADVAMSTPFSYGQARGTDTATDRPLNSIDPAKLTLGLKLDGLQWNARLDATYVAAKTVGDLESPYLPKPVNPPRIEQLTLPEATTLDLHLQWRLRKDLRANFAVINLTDRKIWHWSDVQGLAASSAVIDAYTQPGRHLNLSLQAEW
jgi:hemoglobin/transferrin/lactoferrin receptor protein